MKRVLVFMLLLAAAIACKPAEEIIPASPDALIGRWTLVEPSSPYTITLNVSVDSLGVQLAGFQALRFSGRAPINGYFARARFSKGPSIESGPLGTGRVMDMIATQIGGTAEANRVENWYLGSLQSVNRYELTNRNRLRLYYGGQPSGLLIYERVR